MLQLGRIAVVPDLDGFNENDPEKKPGENISHFQADNVLKITFAGAWGKWYKLPQTLDGGDFGRNELWHTRGLVAAVVTSRQPMSGRIRLTENNHAGSIIICRGGIRGKRIYP